MVCYACCKGCQRTSPNTTERVIIGCSACATYWHLDCLNPPLTHPPVVRSWRCPLHVDDMVERSSFLYPAHRHRVVKDAAALVPGNSRTTANNGLVEVIDDLAVLPSLPMEPGMSATEAAAEAEVGRVFRPARTPESLATTYPDPASFGRVHKLQASQIAAATIKK